MSIIVILLSLVGQLASVTWLAANLWTSVDAKHLHLEPSKGSESLEDSMDDIRT